MLASVLFAICLLAFAFAQDSCRNEYDGYCCKGSIISTGKNGDDLSQLICCVEDPNDNSINIGVVSTCTAGTAAPLTQQTSATGDFTLDILSSTIVIPVGGGSVSPTADTTATRSAASASSAGTTGSAPSQESTATAAATTAAATSSRSGAITLWSPSRLEGVVMFVAGWLMAAL